MPATVRATLLSWIPRPWRRSAAGTIQAAASFTRLSPDGAVGGASGGNRDGGADLRRSGFPAGGCAENTALAAACRRDRQLPAAAGLDGGTCRRPAAAAGDAGGGCAAVGGAAALAGNCRHCAAAGVRRRHGRQYRARPHAYRLRLRPGISRPAAELGPGGAQPGARLSADALAPRGYACFAIRDLDRRCRGAGLFPALSAVQRLFRAAPRPPLCLKATPC